MSIRTALAGGLLAAASLAAQDVAPGRAIFETRCARCHGGDALGGEFGPSIVERLPARNDQQLKTLVHEGLPSRGMPGFDLGETEVSGLMAYLRSIQRRASGSEAARATVQTTDGRTLEGEVLNQGFADLQLRTGDRRVHLLRRAGERFREVTSETGWPGYNGDPRGNRYTTLEQITPSNVAQLGGRWVFTLPNTARLEVTPVVVDGLMYVTSANECYALDAGSGRQVWRYRRPRTAGLTGNAAAGINRGVAVAGGLVFMATDHAHLIALDRFTGELTWETEMADRRQNYFATSAPLAAGGLVITGVGGGELGSRGFVAAFDQATGKEAWRFWTVPKPGEPGSETWEGAGIEHGGAPTWFTGTYDPELKTIYWPTGNPSAEHNGDDRQGDNLYSDCVLALDLKTGRLKWHYQFTPHDLWDWDATETPLLIDAEWQGRPRKLLAQANRNGFFYVLDRTDGRLLLAKPFVNNISWASGIGPDGRPVKLPNQEPTEEGTRVCPALDGATNWFSPSYNPATGLFFVQTLERCGIFTKAETGEWEPGKAYMGGSQRRSPTDKSEKILRAIDLKTGAIAWELPQPGPGNSWGGTLATASGLVFFCEEGGALMAADAKTGKPLWSFQTGQSWKASPMTYMFDGKQYIAVASGGGILAFSLP